MAAFAAAILLWQQAALAVPEYELKAAFLYNFALYTEWPTRNNSLNICVLGDDPFGNALDALARKTVQESRVTVKRIISASESKSCQVLFIAASEHHSMNSIAQELHGLPVLTIAEEDGYDARLVMISLGERQNRLAFKINRSAALHSGLTLSSKLLHLATEVY